MKCWMYDVECPYVNENGKPECEVNIGDACPEQEFREWTEEMVEESKD